MILLFFLTLFLRQSYASPVSGGKDVGEVKKYLDKSTVINPGTFAYVVDLRVSISVNVKPENLFDVRRCGGVIIRSDVILTAAHCIGVNVKDAEIVAWAGIVDKKKQIKEGQRINVKKYKMHEDYRLNNGQIFSPNDIALLWLNSSFVLSPLIKIAKLPKEPFDAQGKYGSIVGWGRNECGEVPSMLQKASMIGIRKFNCQKYFRKVTLSGKVICVLSDDRKSANNYGDSGGPFVVDDTVMGISSFGELMYATGKDGRQVAVCDPNIPGVYTDVSKYTDWINENLRSMSKSPSRRPASPPPPPPSKRTTSMNNRGK